MVLDVRGLNCAPFDHAQLLEGGVDPVTTVVYSCTGADVEMVVVDGSILVEGRKLVEADEGDILVQARAAVKRIRDAAGVRVRVSRNYS